jgi:hypothetical protein
MVEPTAFGWYHIMWLAFIGIAIFGLYKIKDNHSETQLKTILAIYGVVVLLTEILKQLTWSIGYDTIERTVFWDYTWYAFPFQLCSTPMYVALICMCLKKCKIRDCLLSYVAYITILGSIATIVMPDSCFTTDVLVNFHTSWLHFGSFVVSVYLLMSGEVKIDIKTFKNAIPVFLIGVGIATFLNFYVHNTGILNGETFNMFYISPYFVSELPVFCTIQQEVPYIIFLLTYIFALTFGGFIIFCISSLIAHKTILIEDKTSAQNKIHHHHRLHIHRFH